MPHSVGDNEEPAPWDEADMSLNNSILSAVKILLDLYCSYLFMQLCYLEETKHLSDE